MNPLDQPKKESKGSTGPIIAAVAGALVLLGGLLLALHSTHRLLSEKLVNGKEAPSASEAHAPSYPEELPPPDLDASRLEIDALEEKGEISSTEGYSEDMDPEAMTIRNKAVRLAKSGRVMEALQEMDRARKLDPDNQLITRDMSHLSAALGWNSFKDRNYNKALGFFSESVYYWPENQEAHRGMAYSHYMSGDRAEAEKWLLSYIEEGGDRPDSYTLLGNIYYEWNRLEDARYFYEMSLAIDPEQPGMVSTIEKIDRELRVEAGYKKSETRHFLIKYEGDSLPAAARVVEVILEEAYIVVGRNLGVYPERPITVILYTDRAFQDVTRSPTWAGAIFDGKIRIPAKGLEQRTQVLERIVFHEYTHAVVHEVSKGTAPIWLHEGLAQYNEGLGLKVRESALKVVSAGGPVPLSSLEGSFMSMPKGQAELAYLESRLAVAYLEDMHGPFALREILDLLGRDYLPKNVIEEVTGLDYSTFELDFQYWVKDQAR